MSGTPRRTLIAPVGSPNISKMDQSLLLDAQTVSRLQASLLLKLKGSKRHNKREARLWPFLLAGLFALLFVLLKLLCQREIF